MADPKIHFGGRFYGDTSTAILFVDDEVAFDTDDCNHCGWCCPAIGIRLTHNNNSVVSVEFWLNTNHFSSFVFSGDSDDFVALVRKADSIAVAGALTAAAVYTLPANYILFRNTSGSLDVIANATATLTDGTHTFVFSTLGGSPHSYFTPVADAEAGGGFSAINWGSTITKADLIAAGLVDADGVARVRFASAGDAGGAPAFGGNPPVSVSCNE